MNIKGNITTQLNWVFVACPAGYSIVPLVVQQMQILEAAIISCANFKARRTSWENISDSKKPGNYFFSKMNEFLEVFFDLRAKLLKTVLIVGLIPLGLNTSLPWTNKMTFTLKKDWLK